MQKKKDLMALWRTVKACERCAISSVARKKVFGDGNVNSRIVLVGEAPGMDEDQAGYCFVGAAGRILNDALAAAGLVRKKLFACNICKCHPPKVVAPEVSGNRPPSASEIQACAPYLFAQLSILRPAVIVALGGTALSVLANPSPATPDTPGKEKKKYKITDHVGRMWYADENPSWNLPYGSVLVATYHPQYLGYSGSDDLRDRYIRGFRAIKEIAGR